jgi:hypothetical protein
VSGGSRGSGYPTTGNQVFLGSFCRSVCSAADLSRVVAKVPSFKEQLALFADHGVIVAPHGAGLMNLVFAPPFGAVVEIFPYQTHHNLYPAVSAMMGLAHYPVHTYNGSTIIDVDEVRFEAAAFASCFCHPMCECFADISQAKLFAVHRTPNQLEDIAVQECGVPKAYLGGFVRVRDRVCQCYGSRGCKY